jgi:hypothetical protein
MKLMYLCCCLTQGTANTIASLVNAIIFQLSQLYCRMGNFEDTIQPTGKNQNQRFESIVPYISYTSAIAPRPESLCKQITNALQSVTSTHPTNHGYHATVFVYIQVRSRHTVTMEGKIDHKPFPSVGELFHFLHGHCTAIC